MIQRLNKPARVHVLPAIGCTCERWETMQDRIEIGRNWTCKEVNVPKILGLPSKYHVHDET